MHVILETDRLIVRELVEDDAEAVLGFNGLKYLPELGETDLGYRLCRDCWGRGFATESSLAIVRRGFEVLGLEHILGLVLPGNHASIRVLEKIGRRRAGNVEIDGVIAQRWMIER